MPTLKSQISELIAQARLDDAVAFAKQQALAGWIELDTPATLISAELNYLKQCVARGLLTFTDESIKRQDLSFRLISVVEDAEKRAATQPPAAATQKDVILFLGANPFHHLALELEREVEAISAGLSRFGQRGAFDFRAKMHVTPADLQRMLLEARAMQPRFVHFAGNAVADHPDYGTGVIFEDEHGQPRIIDGVVLAGIFRQFPSVECVFLNTCDSGPSALAIGREVRYAIGMNARVYDEVAIEFAVAFYEAIAGGNDVPFAFDFARMRVQLGNAPEQTSLPVLISNGQCPDPVYVPGNSHLVQVEPRIMR